MGNLKELKLRELIKLYNIILHNRGILSDEFYVADLIRDEIVKRLMPDALELKKKNNS